MSNQKILKIVVPTSYELSEFIKGCSAEDNTLLFNYGEALLKTHKATVCQNIESTKVNNLTKSIREKEQKLDKLRRMIMKSNDDKEKITREKEEDIMELKTSYETNITIVKTKAKHEYSKKLDDINKINIDKLRSLANSNQLEVQLLNDKIRKNLNLIDGERERVREETSSQYDKIISHLNTQIQNLEAKLDKDREQGNQSLILMEKERKHARMEAGVHYDKMISNLESQIKKSEHEKNTAVLRLEEERKINDEKIHKERNNILSKLDPILQYYSYDNMIDKGNKGENMIQKILKKYYNNAVINDVSGEAHNGDIHFILNNMKCLIEVKREKTVTSKDIDKFLDDIKTQCANINCGLFISLEAENIPKKGSFFVEVICNIPVLFLYLYNNDCIRYAVNILRSLSETFSMKTKKEIISSEFQRTIKKLVSNQYSVLMLEKKRVNSVIKQLTKTIQELKNGQSNMEKSIKSVLSFYDDNEDMRNDEIKKEIKEIKEMKLYTQDQMEKLEKWTIKHDKPPKRNEVMTILNLNYYDTSKVSMRKLQNILKQNITK